MVDANSCCAYCLTRFRVYHQLVYQWVYSLQWWLHIQLQWCVTAVLVICCCFYATNWHNVAAVCLQHDVGYCNFFSCVSSHQSIASGYASQLILSRSRSLEIGRVVAGRTSGEKYLGCMAGFTLALICVAAANLLVVTKWEAWVREDHWFTKGLVKTEWGNYKGSVGLVLGFFVLLSAVSPGS